MSLGETAVNLQRFTSFVVLNKVQLSLGLISFVWVFFFWKYMEILFVIYCLLLNINVFSYFYNSFDKLILIFNFIFMVISYTFILLLRSEKKEPVYEPKFKKHFLGRKCELNIPCRVNTGSREYSGYLTNWDSNGVFVFLDGEQKIVVKGKVDLEFDFCNKTFKNKGIVRTNYGNGYGVSIHKNGDGLNWKKLYNVLNDRGYKPRYS